MKAHGDDDDDDDDDDDARTNETIHRWPKMPQRQGQEKEPGQIPTTARTRARASTLTITKTTRSCRARSR